MRRKSFGAVALIVLMAAVDLGAQDVDRRQGWDEPGSGPDGVDSPLHVRGGAPLPPAPDSGWLSATKSAAEAARGGGTTELDALLAEAERSNPEIRSRRRLAQAARARVPQAGALPDPTLALSVTNFPAFDPSFTRDPMTMSTVRVGERFPWPGVRELREEVAHYEAEAAEWEVERVRRRVRSEVKSAYYQLYFVDRAVEVTGRNEGLLADFARITAAGYAVGDGAQPEVLRAQVERSRLVDQELALRQRRVEVVARINALLGRPTDTEVPEARLPEALLRAALSDAPHRGRFASSSLTDLLGAGGRAEAQTLPTARELQERAEEHSPMIRAHLRRVEARERAVALAEKERRPDLNVSVGYSRRADFDDFMDVTVSVPLPVFAGRKQGQRVIEEAAVLADHQLRHHVMLNDLNAEIESLVADLGRARDQLLLLDDGILPQARATLASASAAYRVGEVDFLALLDAQVTLYRHELDYHKLLADFARDVAELERVVGTEVLR